MNRDARIAAIADQFRAPDIDVRAVRAYLAGTGPLTAIRTWQLHREVVQNTRFESLSGLVSPDTTTLDTLDLRLLDICCHIRDEWTYLHAIAEQGPAEQVRAALLQRDRTEMEVVDWFIRISKNRARYQQLPATALDRVLFSYIHDDFDRLIVWSRENNIDAFWLAHLMLNADPPLLEKSWQILQDNIESIFESRLIEAARLLLTRHHDVFFERLRPKLQARIEQAGPSFSNSYLSDIFELLVQQPWPGRRPYVATLLAHRTQYVRTLAVNWLSAQGAACIPDVTPFLEHTTPQTRLAAVRVFAELDDAESHALLTARLASESSALVRQAILDNTGFPWATASDQHDPQPFISALTAEATAQTKKPGKPALPWFDPQHAPPLHWTTGDPVAPEIITYLFALQSQSSGIGMVRHLRQIAALLEPPSAVAWALVLWQGWLDNGATAKTAWCLSLAGAFGDDRLVLALRAQIDALSKKSRLEMAARIVQTMALVGSDLALATVADIARRARHKQVVAAANNALNSAARSLGITPAELTDRIVPTLGFDAQGEQVFDYGPRQFIARLHPDGTLRCRDAAGKVRTSPPKPARSDDPDKAAAAQHHWKQLKTQIKQVLPMQQLHLEQALIDRRAWDVRTWTKLFMQHPLLRIVAVTLVWAVRTGDTSGNTLLFRPLDDGTLTDADDEPVTLPDTGQVRLVHPLELDAETGATWRAHLADYEIVPPFAQLNRPVTQVPPEQHDELSYQEYQGYLMNGATFKWRYRQARWQQGLPGNGGVYTIIWKLFPAWHTVALLEMTGLPAGDERRNVALLYLKFMDTRTSTVQPDNYEHRAYLNDICRLGDVPPIVFSEAVAEVQRFAAAGQYDPDWKQKAR